MREAVYAVLLHGEHVGSIQRHDAFTKFVLDADYWDRPDRSVLGVWFENHPREHSRGIGRVPAWFSNLLPEGRLRELIAREQGVSARSEIDLLARIGTDLPGAVTVLPGDGAKVEGSLEAVSDSPPRHAVPRGGKRASLAGMAMKFSVRRDDGRLALPTRGEDGDWILKIPNSSWPGLPANEHAVMGLARSIGIDVPAIELWERADIDDLGPGAWPSAETEAYAIRRFDRTEEGRVHIEDFAQVLGRFGAGEGKYASNVETIAGLAHRGQDDASLREMVRRTVFNLLVGNGDAHLKNWSLIYPDRRRARLSPAYDLVCTSVHLPNREDPDLGLPFFEAERFSEVGRERFAQLQTKLGVGPEDVIDVVDETVERFCDTWASGARDHMPPNVAEWIGKHLHATRSRLLATS